MSETYEVLAVDDALKALDVDAGEVRSVIITHMHYDHAGTVPSFPKAEFVLQERPVAYASGCPRATCVLWDADKLL